MAKKDKIQDLDKEERGGSGKFLTVLIVFLIVLIWLAILALLIKFDVGGLGSEVLRPVLKDIPVINRILPDVSEEQAATIEAQIQEKYGSKTEITVINGGQPVYYYIISVE